MANSESTGCGGGIGGIVAILGIALTSMLRFADNAVLGCGRSVAKFDDVGRSASVYDDLGRNASRVDEFTLGESNVDRLGRTADLPNDVLAKRNKEESLDGLFNKNRGDLGGNPASGFSRQSLTVEEKHFFDNFFMTNPRFSPSEKKILQGWSNSLPKEAKGSFAKHVLQFGKDLSGLDQVFTNDDQVENDYKDSFLATGSLTEAGNAIVPQELMALSSADKRNELFGLLKGMKITKEQAEILSRITKRSLVATPRKYDNYVLVERKGKVFIVKTTSGIFQKRLINIFDETQVSESTTVVLIGQAESTIFMLCTRKGVSDIQRYDSYMDYLEKGAFE